MQGKDKSVPAGQGGYGEPSWNPENGAGVVGRRLCVTGIVHFEPGFPEVPLRYIQWNAGCPAQEQATPGDPIWGLSKLACCHE